MDPSRFAAPFGEAWSPADNVRHLTKSTVPVTRGLWLPTLVLRVLFGPGTASTPYPELVDRYHQVLAAGGQAGPPSPQKPPDDLHAWQQAVVSECRVAVRELGRAVRMWDDEDLDRYRMLHPLLGKLTVREMLFFTLYHYEHHRVGVARRLEGGGDGVQERLSA